LGLCWRYPVYANKKGRLFHAKVLGAGDDGVLIVQPIERNTLLPPALGVRVHARGAVRAQSASIATVIREQPVGLADRTLFVHRHGLHPHPREGRAR
jgi:hypothetical protein